VGDASEVWNLLASIVSHKSLALIFLVMLDNVGIMEDTFHMNIEEDSMAEAIRNSGEKLLYIHIADSNRAAPGRGHINFKPVVQAIKDIDYQGYLSFELLPAAADPFRVLKEKGAPEFFEEYTKESIQFMKRLFGE